MKKILDKIRFFLNELVSDKIFLSIWIVAVIARVTSIFLLYYMELPDGGYLEETHIFKCISRSIAADVGSITVLAFVGATIARCTKKIRLGAGLQIALSTLYIVCSVCDNETTRWLSRRFTIGYIKTYMNSGSDPAMVINLFKAGLFSYSLDILLIVLTLGLGILSVKVFKKKVPSITTLLVFFLIGFTGIYLAYYYPMKSRQFRERIRPFYVQMYKEFDYKRTHSVKPEHFEEGIRFLGGDPSKKYPFYNVVNEDSSLKAFNEKPLSEKPDIILFTVETWRGWTADIRVDKICKKLPNICKLSKEGIFFPYAYSSGWPSTEGLNGMLRGTWSHPEKYLGGYDTRERSWVEFLGKAGYFRVVVPAANPNFDNFTPLFNAWFDSLDYHSDIDNDVKLANRTVEIYKNRPKDRPIFIDWMGLTTHMPFTFPPDAGLGPTPKPYDERYERLISFVDSAIGIVLDEVNKSNRPTIVVLTGDHSFSNGGQKERTKAVGVTHSGRTWIPLFMAGPGIPKDSINTDNYSQVDIAPTLLKLLGLEMNNHFVGVDILDTSTSNTPRITFNEKYYAVRYKTKHIYGSGEDKKFVILKSHKVPDWDTTQIVGGFVGEDFMEPTPEDSLLHKKAQYALKAWQYVLDQDLLMPEEESKP